jgi:hypothetical protein
MFFSNFLQYYLLKNLYFYIKPHINVSFRPHIMLGTMCLHGGEIQWSGGCGWRC